MFRRSSTFRNCTLVRFGKFGCTSSKGPNCLVSSALISGRALLTEEDFEGGALGEARPTTTQWGLPMAAAQKVKSFPPTEMFSLITSRRGPLTGISLLQNVTRDRKST